MFILALSHHVTILMWMFILAFSHYVNIDVVHGVIGVPFFQACLSSWHTYGAL
jgi:hypothetical protein